MSTVDTTIGRVRPPEGRSLAARLRKFNRLRPRLFGTAATPLHLHRLNDHTLRDIGLRRDQIGGTLRHGDMREEWRSK